VSAPTVVILAAGQGTRMKSATPKVLHDLCGWPMVFWPVHAARGAGAGKVVVVGGPDRVLEGRLPEGVELAVQAEPKGTGDAAKAAIEHFSEDETVVVLYGDTPLITAKLLADLVEAHERSGAAATVTTTELDDPSGYGRIVRGPDGSVEHVAETKVEGDASAAELAINEVNTGIYAFEGGGLKAALGRISADNAQGEYYLPDVLKVFRGDDHGVAAFEADDPSIVLGVNDRVDLAHVRKLAQARIHVSHMAEGVTIVDPGSTLIDVGVTLGPDTVVEPSSFLRGHTHAGEGCVIGPVTTLIDCDLHDRVKVPHSYGVESEIGSDASIGPFAYLRPGTVVGDGAKIGTFVEVKNSDIGDGAKVPHLSYIGDAEIGEGTNLGASTITANYDGFEKHRTKVGSNAHTGIHTSLVAPVELGDDAWTAAGSAITNDIPDGALGVAREKQRNIEGYDERKKREHE
jgi:bifunctional UDP-N-acetylglucosamine pyrophosphorylase / glucosamine-1-phosphate N-acetyltransferase